MTHFENNSIIPLSLHATTTPSPQWCSGTAVALWSWSTLRRSPYVLGWVTVSGFSSRCGTFISVCYTSHADQLSLDIPSWVGAMSTSQRAMMPCGSGVKAAMVCVRVAGKTVW